MVLRFHSISKGRLACILFILAMSPASAHGEPTTKEEIQELIDSQSSIYHCYPEILSQLETRKSALLGRTVPSFEFVDQNAAEASNFNTLEFDSSQSKDPFYPHTADALTCSKSTTLSSAIASMRNSTCVFSPIVRAGPYFHKQGHPIRQELTEWQDGLPLSLDIGVIDVETCRPIKGALVDLWHANATGSYSGHPTPKPGFENEKPQVGGARAGLLTAYPRTNFDEHWLRGAWPTNENGVAQFSTIFPGFYTGRATHIHAEVHMDWEMMANGTFNSSHVQYVGQFFFDDVINLSVDKMWPYSQNPVKDRTRNWRDSLKVFQESRSNSFHPIIETHKVGSVINKGLVGFITVGIKPSNRFDHEYNPVSSDLDL